MAVVLCTGVDPALIATRKLLLERASHTVVTAMNDREILQACSTQPFHVAVIGQTMSHKVKRHIANLIRENCPSARILELYAPHEGRALEPPLADAWLLVPTDVPSELPDAVDKLARVANRQLARQLSKEARRKREQAPQLREQAKKVLDNKNPD